MPRAAEHGLEVHAYRECMERAIRPAIAQGAYFSAAGLWPLVHMRSFEAVTGPKRERWLVKTVGALALTIGGTLLFSAWRRDVSPTAAALGAGTAAAFAGIDVWYAGKGRISPVYLLDALVELGLIASWARVASRKGRPGYESRAVRPSLH